MHDCKCEGCKTVTTWAALPPHYATKSKTRPRLVWLYCATCGEGRGHTVRPHTGDVKAVAS